MTFQHDEAKRWRPWQFSLKTLLILMLLSASLLASGRYWYINYLVPRQPLPWRDFDPGLVQRLRADGKGLLIHFTADWDISTASQRIVMDTAPVRRAVHKYGFVPILVDCTHRTSKSIQFLQSYGVNVVPLTVIETGETGASPIVIDGFFTSDHLVSELTTARKQAATQP